MNRFIFWVKTVDQVYCGTFKAQAGWQAREFIQDWIRQNNINNVITFGFEGMRKDENPQVMMFDRNCALENGSKFNG